MRIEGANVNLPGVGDDKLGFKDAKGRKFCSVERRIGDDNVRAISTTPTARSASRRSTAMFGDARGQVLL